MSARRGLAVAILLMCGAPAWAQDGAIEAVGEMPVVGGDRVRAREMALGEALRQAVEQTLALLVEPEVWTQQAPKLRAQFAGRTKDFIVNYRVLEESVQAGVLRVRIAAQVAMGALTRELNKTLAAAKSAAPLGGERWALHLDGMDNYSEILAFERATSTLPGVSLIVPRRFFAGTVELEVSLPGAKIDFNAMLGRVSLEGIRVASEIVSEHALLVHLVHAPTVPPPEAQ